jgi:hypothetical protein
MAVWDLNSNLYIQHADILKRTYLCQVSDTGSPEPLVCYKYIYSQTCIQLSQSGQRKNDGCKTGDRLFQFGQTRLSIPAHSDSCIAVIGR